MFTEHLVMLFYLYKCDLKMCPNSAEEKGFSESNKCVDFHAHHE